MVLRNSIVSSLLEAVPFPAEAVLKIAATLLADVPTQAQMISRQRRATFLQAALEHGCPGPDPTAQSKHCKAGRCTQRL